MSYAAIAIAGTGIASALITRSAARKQQRQAEAINPVDPGPNQALLDNARILGDRSSNYMMPGFSAAEAGINASAASAYDNAVQGAASSGDVLDAAARIAYGQQSSLNNLHTQNAAGRDQALLQYLNANAAAGADSTGWQRQQFLNDQQRRAQLMNAGQLNEMNAIQDGLGAIGTAGAYYFANRPSNPMTPGSASYINQQLPGAEVVRNSITPVGYAGVTQSNAMPSGTPNTAVNGAPYITPATYASIKPRPVTPTFVLPYR